MMQIILVCFDYPGSTSTYIKDFFLQISCCRSKFSKQPTEWKLRLTTRGSKGNISGQCLSSRISTGLSKLFNGRSLDWHRNKTEEKERSERDRKA